MIRYIILSLVLLIPATAHAVTLRILEWENYISPYAKEFEAWAKQEAGVDVTLEFILPNATNPEQIFRAVRAEEADIVTPTHNYFKMYKAKLARALLPLDFSKLSNYKDITQSLRQADFDEVDGAKYSVPLVGGSYGLAYNQARTKEPTSWEELWNPANKGTYSITSEQFEANVYLSMIMAGYPPQALYDIDAIDFDRAKIQQYLNVLVINAHSFWKGMTGVETMRSLKFSTTYWIGVKEANKQGQHWRIATPKEGETVWFDTISLSNCLHNAPEKLHAAYLLIDYMISPKIQKKLHEDLGLVIVNNKTSDLMTPEQIATSRVGDETFFEEKWLWQSLTARTRNMYKLMWQEAVRHRNAQIPSSP